MPERVDQIRLSVYFGSQIESTIIPIRSVFPNPVTYVAHMHCEKSEYGQVFLATVS